MFPPAKATARGPRLLQSSNLFEPSMFWKVNGIGWTFYFFAVALIAWVWEEEFALKTLYSLSAAVSGFLLTLGMRAVFKRLDGLALVKGLCVAVGAILVAAAIWSAFKLEGYILLMQVEYPEKEKTLSLVDFVRWLIYSFFILLSWSGLYFGCRFYRLWELASRQALTASNLAKEAQLRALHSQLNPHFLFNALNALSTLILEGQNEGASQMLAGLSRLLRKSLQSDPARTISLREELEHLDLYLDIERIRFGERLRIERGIETESLDARVPAMLLQPLAENAIKHAVARREAGACLTLSARCTAGSLHLCVADDGPGLQKDTATGHSNADPQSGGGLGLANVRNRLWHFYGDQAALRLLNREGGGLQVEIQIPIQVSAIRKTDAYAVG